MLFAIAFMIMNQAPRVLMELGKFSRLARIAVFISFFC